VSQEIVGDLVHVDATVAPGSPIVPLLLSQSFTAIEKSKAIAILLRKIVKRSTPVPEYASAKRTMIRRIRLAVDELGV
jgi:hypothetical protein